MVDIGRWGCMKMFDCTIFCILGNLLYYQIKMHHIISDISNPVNLQQYIDNRDGFKRVGLKSFTYCWGWYNIHDEVL